MRLDPREIRIVRAVHEAWHDSGRPMDGLAISREIERHYAEDPSTLVDLNAPRQYIDAVPSREDSDGSGQFLVGITPGPPSLSLEEQRRDLALRAYKRRRANWLYLSAAFVILGAMLLALVKR